MGLMRLGLSNPSANTDVSLYTATGPFLASIIATNKSASVTSNVRMWIVPSGATLTSQYAYLAYDQDLVPQNTLETHRFALNQNDVVYVRADTADMSFMINGLKQVDIALAAGVTSYSNTPPLDVMDGMIWVDKDGNGSALNTLAGQVIQSNATSQVPLTVRGITSQTADIFDVQNSASTDLFSVNKDGVVRIPFQPSFFVSNENGSNSTGGNKMTFNTVVTNVNSCWSAANNRFTAPVTGKYFFDYSILNGAAAAFYIQFRKNGTAMTVGQYPRSYTAGQFYSNTASGVLELNANDYIELWVEAGTAHTYHCFFTGYLIG